uniref:Uncharacterized protein n=1 Tax=Oryzias latipes TaxID=8090 RepID=A0A3P9GXG8_ORYLA
GLPRRRRGRTFQVGEAFVDQVCPFRTGNGTITVSFLVAFFLRTSRSWFVSCLLDVSSYPPYLKDLIHSQLCQHLGLWGTLSESGVGVGDGGCSREPSPTAGSPDTLCSSMCSLDEQHPLLRDLGGHRDPHSNAAELAAKILSAVGQSCRPCGGQDSPCYSMSYSETYLSPGEDDDAPCKDYQSTMCQVEAEGNEVEYPSGYDPSRRVSDVASSGVVSLDEEDFEEELEERAGQPNNQ